MSLNSEKRCSIHAPMFEGGGAIRKCSTSTNDLSASNANDVQFFFHTNPNLLRLGNRRSVENMYQSLWSLVYDPSCYGPCACDNSTYRATLEHRVSWLATYPHVTRGMWDHETALNGDVANTRIVNVSTLKTLGDRQHAAISTTSNDTTSRTDNETVFHDTLNKMEWYCTVNLSTREPVTSAVKLMDFQHRDPREVWILLSQVLMWCDDVYTAYERFPVRRSLWDLLLLNETRLIACVGLTDVGDADTFVFSMRILLLIFYMGCSYGGVSRTLSVNERVSNKRHECLFPPKTPGVYHALFATSKAPHRLVCLNNVNLATGSSSRSSGISTSQTCVSNDHSIIWLREFRGLFDRACERYTIPSYDWCFLQKLEHRNESLDESRQFENCHGFALAR